MEKYSKTVSEMYSQFKKKERSPSVGKVHRAVN